MPTPIALLGAGERAKRRANAIWAVPEFYLASIWSKDAKLAHFLAEQHDISFASDILEESIMDVEAVAICTPRHTHGELTRFCLERGLHVLVEPPLTTSLEEAEQLTKLAKQQGKVLEIGHQHRYHPLYREAKTRIEAGGLGTPVFTSLQTFSPTKPSEANQGTDRMTAGGVPFYMIYDLNLLRFLLGEPTEAVFRGSGIGTNGPETGYMMMSFDNGVSAALQVARKTHADLPPAGLSVVCTLGSIHIPADASEMQVYHKTGMETVRRDEDAFEDQIRAFAIAIRQGGSASCNADGALCELRLLHSIKSD
jgi:predicted dehydrogenase